MTHFNFIWWGYGSKWGFPGGSVVKNHLPIQETQETKIWSVGQEDSLEEEMATHSSILAWKIPWTDEPGGLQSMGSQRVRYNWVDWACTHIKLLGYENLWLRDPVLGQTLNFVCFLPNCTQELNIASVYDHNLNS